MSSPSDTASIPNALDTPILSNTEAEPSKDDPLTSTAAGSLTPDEAKAVGQWLYSSIQIVFDSHPQLDELGLIAGMPSTGLGRKGDSAATGASTGELDPYLKEFHSSHPPPAAFLSLQASNGSPPFIVMESSKLGLSFWAVPFIIKAAAKIFAIARQRVKGLTKQELSDMVAKGGQIHLPLLQSTRVLVLVNADNYTAWNARKLLLSCPPYESSESKEKKFLLTPSIELRLLNLVYSKHPKSGESWNHRRWVLSWIEGLSGSQYHFAAGTAESAAQSTVIHPLESIDLPTIIPGVSSSSSTDAPPMPSDPSSIYPTRLFQSELAMCERSASLYPKNYYAWMHRQWLVERLTSLTDLESELHRAGEWTESHINDYCGFVHRQVVWNHWLALIERNSNKTVGLSKAETHARVHVNLVQRLKEWSRVYPMHETFSANATGGSTSSHVASVSPATPVAPSPMTTSPVNSFSLHSALASCRFCQPFSHTEWSHLSELQLRYPGHETLWMHRRFVWLASILGISDHSPITQRGVMPDWLLPLVQREIDYAEFQIRDRELSNYDANTSFATIYKAWIYQTTMTLIYSPHTATVSSLSPTGSLVPSGLSSAHKSQLLQSIQAILRLSPTIPSYHHWEERAKTIQMMS